LAGRFFCRQITDCKLVRFLFFHFFFGFGMGSFPSFDSNIRQPVAVCKIFFHLF
jgi:hypothetical protein